MVGLPWTAWATHESCCCFRFLSFCIRIQHWSKLLAPNQLCHWRPAEPVLHCLQVICASLLSIEGHFGRGCLILGRDLQKSYKLTNLQNFKMTDGRKSLQVSFTNICKLTNIRLLTNLQMFVSFVSFVSFLVRIERPTVKCVDPGHRVVSLNLSSKIYL